MRRRARIGAVTFGTAWDGDAVVVDGVTVPVGTAAVFVGGESTLTPERMESMQWVKPPLVGCLDHEVWWIQYVNPES